MSDELAKIGKDAVHETVMSINDLKIAEAMVVYERVWDKLYKFHDPQTTEGVCSVRQAAAILTQAVITSKA